MSNNKNRLLDLLFELLKQLGLLFMSLVYLLLQGLTWVLQFLTESLRQMIK